MRKYLDIVKMVLDKGTLVETRTGTKAYTMAGAMFEHDMEEGFPLLTTKKIPFRLVATELEFFIKGLTDKEWLKERNNHIWDEWAHPAKAPYGHDEDSKASMMKERDLGPVYGFQWRHWNTDYNSWDTDYTDKGIDQLKNLVEKLKTNPRDRRMIVSAWNPEKISEMALPPCHYSFQVTVIENKLNLMWNQRSVDTMLGLPFNIASYALLLYLLAKEAGLKEGKLIGFLGDVHIYENHREGAMEQLKRNPDKHTLPKIETNTWKSIFEWKAEDTNLIDYKSYPRIPFQIAV